MKISFVIFWLLLIFAGSDCGQRTSTEIIPTKHLIPLKDSTTVDTTEAEIVNQKAWAFMETHHRSNDLGKSR